MAAALPLVASDIPGYREVCRHGMDGLLVRPSDPSALAAGVRTLLDEPDYARALGENGYRRSRAFAWDKVVDQLEAVYAKLLGEPGHEPAVASYFAPV
jgi:glycosyltransferase involved in cell wall biosynthesis